MDKFVSWGGTKELESHRHILRHYHTTARKMGIKSMWLPDEEASREHLTAGSVVFAYNITGSHLGPAIPGVKYALHNFDMTHPVCQTADPDYLLRLQVYTNEASGEEWAPFRFYHREAHLLFQPWGTDLLPEEFWDPVFNPTSQTVPFVGAVWKEIHDGVDMGNETMTNNLKTILGERHLALCHHTHIGDQENVMLVREGRIAPAFAGEWQVEHNYLPCRLFKNVSYGALGITNVPKLAAKVGCPTGPIVKLLDWALGLRKHQYLEFAREQQRFVSAYNYRESLNAIERAFGERGV